MYIKLQFFLIIFLVCPMLAFTNDECSRPNVFYTIGGQVCDIRNSSVTTGKCDVLKPVMGVNFGGPALRDDQEFAYEADKNVNFADPDNFKALGSIPSLEDNPNNVSKNDEPLYTNFLTGSGDKGGRPSKCITYQIPVRNDGHFELSLKTLEPNYDLEEQRSFNILLNGIRVMEEVDLFQVGNGKGIPLDIVVLFRVSDNRQTLSVKGHSISVIKEIQIPLSFCSGGKRDRDGNPVAGAVKVVELGKKISCANPIAGHDKSKFIQTKDHSKFLYPEKIFTASAEDAVQICQKMELEPATIHTRAEYRHLIDDFIRGNLHIFLI